MSNNDIEALLALYTDNAIIESPLISHLLGTDIGICRGKQEIRKFVEIVVKRKPSIRKYFRRGFFTDGKTIMWEYPRITPEGEQMDFVEVMEIKDGLICYHRVYWGWKGFQIMKENAYHSEPK